MARSLPGRKLWLTLLLLCGLGGYAGADTNALFTARTSSEGNAFQAGTVRLAGTPPAGDAIFAVPALLPGDAAEQPLTIQNTGTLDVSYSLLVTAPTPGALDQDPVHGLQLQVDRCVTGRWATPAPASLTHVCLGETPGAGPTVLPIYHGAALNRVAPAPGATPSPAPVPVGTPLAAGSAHALMLRVSLPESALDAGLAGQSSTLDIRWQAEALPPATRVPAPFAATPTATVRP
jgi:predicted ribosomally synthesized peptide with SipW-like signal peptide